MSASLLPGRPSRKSKRRVLSFLIFLAAGIVAVGIAIPPLAGMPERVRQFLARSGDAAKNARVAPQAELLGATAEPAREPPKVKKGRNTVYNGVMLVPEAFVPGEDGSYDLVIHFHGNTDLTLESFEKLGFNAVLVVLNLGTGSAIYEDTFAGPLTLDAMLDRIDSELAKRGLPDAKLRRLALTAWSAGYGAVVRSLEQPRFAELTDAVVLLDGFHVPMKKNGIEPDPGGLSSGVVAFAERAKKGERFLMMTHSNIETMGYASVKQATDLLLGQVALERKDVTGETKIPDLAAVKGVLPRDEMVALVPTTAVDAGDFHVRGYRGNEKAHHISHLLQMSEIALPLLAQRWQTPPAGEPVH
jgi:hypothetical protein